MKILCHYWTTEEPMSKDEMMVASGLSKNLFQKSWPLLEKKFVVENGNYFNRRMRAEIAKAVDITEKRSAAGSKAHQAKAPAKAKQKPTQLQSQLHIHNKEDQKHRSNDFDRWWDCYPKKVGKKPARAIWKRIKPDLEQLIEDTTQRALMDAQWRGGFIPNPTTYLNQERWNDELQTRNGTSGATVSDEYAARQRREDKIISKLNGGSVAEDGSVVPSGVDEAERRDWIKSVPRLDSRA